MSRFHRLVNVQIRGGFYIFLAFAIVLFPFKWLSAWVLAAAVHELGHAIAVNMSGHRIHCLDISFMGARIITDNLDSDEWYCALAGPAFGLLLGLTIQIFPRLGICAIFQSFINLLPIYPMDGGRAIRCALCSIWSEEKGKTIASFIACITTFILIVLISHLKDTGLSCLLITILILTELKTLLRKIPCKHRVKWVQ